MMMSPPLRNNSLFYLYDLGLWLYIHTYAILTWDHTTDGSH